MVTFINHIHITCPDISKIKSPVGNFSFLRNAPMNIMLLYVTHYGRTHSQITHWIESYKWPILDDQTKSGD